MNNVHHLFNGKSANKFKIYSSTAFLGQAVLSDYSKSRRFLQAAVSTRTANWHVYGAIIEMSWFNRHQAGMISGFIISTNHDPVKYYMYRIIKTAIYFQLLGKLRRSVVMFYRYRFQSFDLYCLF